MQGRTSFSAMQDLAVHPDLKISAHRFRELAREMAERDSEIQPWTAAEVRAFESVYAAPAKSGADLMRIVEGVLKEIQFDLDRADASSRPVLQSAIDEDAVQHWLAEQMRLRARGRFHVHREAEVASKNKPDIIASSTAADFEVALEAKHGGKGWTIKKLESALRCQLAEDYLKPANRRHGIFIVTNHRHRKWKHPNTGMMVSFSDVMAYLATIAATVLNNEIGEITVKVVGFDAAPVVDDAMDPSTCRLERQAAA